MGRWMKRIAAALAVKEGIERIQEARRPKKSRARGFAKLLTVVGIGGAIAYLYRSGKLEPMLDQAKGAIGGGDSGGGEMGPAGWSAPAASAGTTTAGATSTSSSV